MAGSAKHTRGRFLLLLLGLLVAMSCGAPDAGVGLVRVALEWPPRIAASGLAVRTIPDATVKVRVAVTGPGIKDAVVTALERKQD